jgi:aminodeoxyfutalosine synthase
VNINLAIAARARAGEALSVAEIDELGASDVLSLGMLADEVRRARVGESVTYVRVIEMAGGAGGAGAAGGAGEVGVEMRLSSLPATLDEAEGLIAEARMLAGPQLLTGFSLADIVDRQWGKLVDVLKRLKRAGLDAIVEAPVDRLHDAEQALKACDEAELPVRCLSLQSPIEGDGRSSWLIHLRDLVQKFPKIDTVNPLSREQSIAVPTTGYEDVRAVALARLALPSVKNIQVDWAQYGPKLAQVALTFGANDLDRVSTVDDESLGRRRTSVEDVKRNIIAAGFTPVERSAGGSEDPPLR